MKKACGIVLLIWIAVVCLCIMSGCTPVLPWWKPEVNKDKKEHNENKPITITNNFPSGTTALEAAEANRKLMSALLEQDKVVAEAKAETKKIEAEAKAARADAKDARSFWERWKSRAIWLVIACIAVAVIFPAWAWRRVIKLKQVIGNTKHSVDRAMEGLPPEQQKEFINNLEKSQYEATRAELKKHK